MYHLILDRVLDEFMLTIINYNSLVQLLHCIFSVTIFSITIMQSKISYNYTVIVINYTIRSTI